MIPVPLQILLSDFHLFVSVHDIHFEVLVFNKLEGESNHLIAFVFGLLVDNELRLILIDQLQYVFEIIALEEALEPGGEAPVSVGGLVSEIVVIEVFGDDGFVEEGDVGFAGELDLICLGGVFFEQPHHNLVINFELLILYGDFDLIPKRFAVIFL